MRIKNRNYKQTKKCPICGGDLLEDIHKECNKKLEKFVEEEKKFIIKIIEESKTTKTKREKNDIRTEI